jgi:hypothetical protein
LEGKNDGRGMKMENGTRCVALSNNAPDKRGRRLTKMRSGYKASTNRTQCVGITVPGDDSNWRRRKLEK